ncbi:steroid receptor RNA activator 1-like [Anopheles ziemanni]|uniref:steroid receptor RNA activator 1-like n=1 Tax=Anopheles coustani TaxID=139045 RepID=UPI00265854CB|nr:steroid receptor RNA activator 1-like [Anopheles coustani]XP_058176123.1 steroid receptor RNA activator 1-like [Anopheles ziemanni]
MSGENYRSATKSHEPGWNDPPKVPAGASGSGSQQPKLALNKRVAFPLQSRPPAVQPTNGPPGAPPIIQPPLGPPATAAPPGGVAKERKQADTAETMVADREEMLALVRAALDDSIHRLEESRREETQKRINLIYEAWTAGKLPEGLEKHLHSLASALEEMDAARAGAIHRSIICDYGGKCALWAPALRQLIFALPQPQNDEQNEPNVIAKPV